MRSALVELLGAKQVLNFLQVDGFVRRAVATVDNLPRERATSRVWPVQPAPDRFTVQGAAPRRPSAPRTPRATRLSCSSSNRSMPRSAAALYAKFYPLFQQAYEELGYPGRYFNDRLVAVIDHLLQAPEPAARWGHADGVKAEIPCSGPGCATSSPTRSCRRFRPARR